MSDLEYLLNCQLNPFQELEFRQDLSELSDLHDRIKETQKLFSTTSFFIPKDTVIPTVSEFGFIVLCFTRMKRLT